MEDMLKLQREAINVRNGLQDLLKLDEPTLTAVVALAARLYDIRKALKDTPYFSNVSEGTTVLLDARRLLDAAHVGADLHLKECVKSLRETLRRL